MSFVVFNQKGGVGKSTLTCNLAAIDAVQGRRTLVIDLDPQANSSSYLLGEAAQADPGRGVAEFFEETLSFSFRKVAATEFVRATPFDGLDLMPASPALNELLVKLESRQKIYKLREALAELAAIYAAIYIDTAPALNFYTRAALIGARRCLIPFDCDSFSRQALRALLQNVEEIRADHSPELVVAGIVVNQFQPRASLPQRMVDGLIAEGLPVLQPYVPASVKVRESHEAATPLIHLDARHKVTLALLALHAQICR